MTNTTRMGLRLKTRVREALEEEARRQNRTLSNMAETALAEWLRDRGYDLSETP